jgi:uncharacterized protein YuzB (UPF0349 family)
MKTFYFITFLCLSTWLGAQTFTEDTNAPFEDLRRSAVAFADVDNDDDLDFMICGKGSVENITKLYINEDGAFTEAMGSTFLGVELSDIAFSDIDNDNDLDVLVIGYNIIGVAPTTRLYRNNGGTFTEITGTPFPNVADGSIAFADVDNDNDEDLVITGFDGNADVAKLYTNNGGTFTENASVTLQAVNASDLAFEDFDNDNDPDLLMVGSSGSNRFAKLYRNENGAFTEVAGTPFVGTNQASVAVADVDNDDDLDVLITGSPAGGGASSKLYLNNGSGSFTEDSNVPFTDVFWGDASFGDVNNDNFVDVLITGFDANNMRIAKLYTNNNGTFTEMAGTPFPPVYSSASAMADIDDDGDLDVVISGFGDPDIVTKLYINGLQSSVENFPLSTAMKVYPNPVRDGMVQLDFQAEAAAELQVQVMSIFGSVLVQQTVQVTNGKNTLSLDLHSLAPGTYLLQVDDGQRKGIQKLVVH